MLQRLVKASGVCSRGDSLNLKAWLNTPLVQQTKLRFFVSLSPLKRGATPQNIFVTDFKFSNKVRVRACAVIVKNSSILLTKINPPTRKEPIWMPPGGGVELGESLEEALSREVKEETGLQIQKGQLLWIHEFIEEPYHAIEFYYRCEIIGGDFEKGIDPELEPDQQMLMDLAFIPFKEANELNIEPKFIKEFCKAGGKFFSDVNHVVSISPPLKGD